MNFAENDAESNSAVNSDQIELSLFRSNKLSSKTAGTQTVEKLVERIRSKLIIKPKWGEEFSKEKLDRLATGNKTREDIRHLAFVQSGHGLSVTFSGTYTPTRNNKHSQKHSELICFNLKNLSLDRANHLRHVLSTDPYTYLLFGTPYNDGLNVVVRYSYVQPEDHNRCFDYLSGYYANRYRVLLSEIEEECKQVNYLCYLPFDPTIYYQPTDERILLPLASEQDNDTVCIDTDKPSCIEPVSSNDYGAFSDERETSKLFDHLRYMLDWCKAGFGLAGALRIDVKWQTNTDSQIISFSEIQNGKKSELVNFEVDTVTNVIMASAKKPIKKAVKGKASNDTNQKVSKILVELLSSGELEHCQVRQLLQKQLACGERKIFGSLREIIADPAIIHNATGKPVKLAKSYHDRKNFLALEPIDGLSGNL